MHWSSWSNVSQRHPCHSQTAESDGEWSKGRCGQICIRHRTPRICRSDAAGQVRWRWRHLATAVYQRRVDAAAALCRLDSLQLGLAAADVDDERTTGHVRPGPHHLYVVGARLGRVVATDDLPRLVGVSLHLHQEAACTIANDSDNRNSNCHNRISSADGTYKPGRLW